MAIKPFTFLVFLFLNCTACVTALTQDELDTIHSIQILTDFEDTFYVNQIGLTVFENDSFQANISDWKLSERALNKVKAALPQHAKVVGVETVQEYAKYSPEEKNFFRQTIEKSIDERFASKAKELLTPNISHPK